MAEGADRVVARAAEFITGPDEAAEEEPAEQPEAVAAPEDEAHDATEEEPELPRFESRVPEDVLEELEQPDFEEDDDDEPEDEQPDEAAEYSEVDPEVRQLRKKLRWQEEQIVRAKRGKWSEEATKYFPLSVPALAQIKATSRRGFLREARAVHNSILPFVNEISQQFNEKLKVERERAREEARSEVEKSWGKPTVQPQGVPTRASDDLRRETKTRNNRGFNLADSISEMWRKEEEQGR